MKFLGWFEHRPFISLQSNMLQLTPEAVCHLLSVYFERVDMKKTLDENKNWIMTSDYHPYQGLLPIKFTKESPNASNLVFKGDKYRD